MREHIGFRSDDKFYVTSDPTKATLLMTFTGIHPDIQLTDNLFFLFPKTEEINRCVNLFKMNYRNIFHRVEKIKKDNKLEK